MHLEIDFLNDGRQLFWKEQLLRGSFPHVSCSACHQFYKSVWWFMQMDNLLSFIVIFLCFLINDHTTEMFPIWLSRITMGRCLFSGFRYGKHLPRNGDYIVYSCCRDQSAVWWAKITYSLWSDNKSCHRFGETSLETSPITLQSSKQFFLLPIDRFQAHAVSNLKIIFLIWNIVSGAQHKSHVEEKYSQELHDFLLGNQNFSIKEFTRKNGFYLNSSTLLECDFFGKPCNPQVNMFILLKQ